MQRGYIFDLRSGRDLFDTLGVFLFSKFLATKFYTAEFTKMTPEFPDVSSSSQTHRVHDNDS